MYIDANTIITAAAVISALTVIFSVIFAAYRWIRKQDQQDVDIKSMKDEQTMICYALLAALNGLIQLGANGEVTKAHDALNKHINKKAHE